MQMTSKKWLFWLVMLLLLGSLLFLLLRPKGEPKDDRKDFEIEETEDIQKIFLKDRNDNSVLLQRSDENWLLNDSLFARKPAVELLLKTMKKIRVKGPVPKTARSNIIRQMAAKAVKVEIYDSKGKLKTYYVGGPTPDQFGTYMYMENSLYPYVVHIPGFDGYLTPRYSVNQDEWESRQIFSIPVKDIQSVSVNYTNEPEYSFKLIKNGEDFTIESDGLTDPSMLNFGAVSSYFSNFKNISYEGYPPMFEQNRAKEDSIKKTPPWCELTVTGNNGKSERLRIWQKEARSDLSLYDQEGNPLAIDPERLYALKDGKERLVHIQILVFKTILVQLQDFHLKNG
jgi:hypothetical protein